MSSIWLADGTFKTVPLYLPSSTLFFVLLEVRIPLLMDTYFLVFTHCFPIRKPLPTLKCGNLLTKLVQILNLTFSLSILNRRLLILLNQFGHNPSKSVLLSPVPGCVSKDTVLRPPATIPKQSGICRNDENVTSTRVCTT